VSSSAAVLGVLGVPGANEYLRFGVDWGRGRAKNLDKLLFAENAYKMGPGNAVGSKSNPLCGGFGLLGPQV